MEIDLSKSAIWGLMVDEGSGKSIRDLQSQFGFYSVFKITTDTYFTKIHIRSRKPIHSIVELVRPFVDAALLCRKFGYDPQEGGISHCADGDSIGTAKIVVYTPDEELDLALIFDTLPDVVV